MSRGGMAAFASYRYPGRNPGPDVNIRLPPGRGILSAMQAATLARGQQRGPGSASGFQSTFQVSRIIGPRSSYFTHISLACMHIGFGECFLKIWDAGSRSPRARIDGILSLRWAELSRPDDMRLINILN